MGASRPQTGRLRPSRSLRAFGTRAALIVAASATTTVASVFTASSTSFVAIATSAASFVAIATSAASFVAITATTAAAAAAFAGEHLGDERLVAPGTKKFERLLLFASRLRRKHRADIEAFDGCFSLNFHDVADG